MRGSGPTVSVIIPAYNCEDTISQTIDSVLDQTLSDFEIIVIDDGSTDTTPELIRDFSDPRIKLHQHGQNQGRSTARNTGVSIANGEFIAYLDSDDIWYPEKLEKQVDSLRTRSDDWVASYCGFTYGWSNKTIQFFSDIIQRPTGKEGGEELIPYILTWRLAVCGGSTLLVRTSTAKEIRGWDNSLKRFEDLGYVIQLLAVGKLAFVDEDLVDIQDSGMSDGKTFQIESQKFREIYSDQVIRAEYDGNDVDKYFQFMVSKHQFSNGEFLAGVKSLRGSKGPHLRDYFGLVKAIGEGIINKFQDW